MKVYDILVENPKQMRSQPFLKRNSKNTAMGKKAQVSAQITVK